MTLTQVVLSTKGLNMEVSFLLLPQGAESTRRPSQGMRTYAHGWVCMSRQMQGGQWPPIRWLWALQERIRAPQAVGKGEGCHALTPACFFSHREAPPTTSLLGAEGLISVSSPSSQSQVSDQSDSWLPSVNGEEGSSEICSPLTPQEGVMAPPCPLVCRGGPVPFQWLHRTYWTKLPHTDWLWHWGCVGGEGGVETFEDHQRGCIAGCDFPLPLGYLPL